MLKFKCEFRALFTCFFAEKSGGLDAVLFECRKNDVETLRHCAGALANLSLYGGAENQEGMISLIFLYNEYGTM